MAGGPSPVPVRLRWPDSLPLGTRQLEITRLRRTFRSSFSLHAPSRRPAMPQKRPAGMAYLASHAVQAAA